MILASTTVTWQHKMGDAQYVSWAGHSFKYQTTTGPHSQARSQGDALGAFQHVEEDRIPTATAVRPAHVQPVHLSY
jgi:hypothetical protein